jgi:hypothetical protein
MTPYNIIKQIRSISQSKSTPQYYNMSPVTAYCIILIIIFIQTLLSFRLVRGDYIENITNNAELEYDRYYQHYYEHLGEYTCPVISSSEAYKPYIPPNVCNIYIIPKIKLEKIETPPDDKNITLEYGLPIIILITEWLFHIINFVMICFKNICIVLSFTTLFTITIIPFVIGLYNIFMYYTF